MNLGSHPLEEALEVLRPIGMLQLANRLRFDLPDPLPRDPKNAADLFERIGIAIAQAITKPDDLSFAPGERLEQTLNLLTKDAVVGVLKRTFAVLIFDQLAERSIFAFADRRRKLNTSVWRSWPCTGKVIFNVVVSFSTTSKSLSASSAIGCKMKAVVSVPI